METGQGWATGTVGGERDDRRSVLVLSGGILLLAVLAMACHGFDQFHQKAMHSVADDEEYCVDFSDSNLDQSSTRVFLDETLYATNAGRNWDTADGGADHGEIFFIPYGNPQNCSVFQTWIKIIIMKDTAEICGTNPNTGLGYACVRHDDQVCEDGHCHYKRERVYLRDGHLSGQNDGSRFVVNHEMGHVFGLRDACNTVEGSDCPQAGWEFCHIHDANGNDVWIDSIMHSPPSYCNSFGQNRYWVRPLDKIAVGIGINSFSP